MQFNPQLAEELAKAQGAEVEIKLLSAFARQAIDAIQELQRQTDKHTHVISILRRAIDDSVLAKDFTLAIQEIQRQSTAQGARIDTLRGVVEQVLEEARTTPRRPKQESSYISTSTMATRAGVSGQPEKVFVLKYYARKFCEENKLDIHKGEGDKGNKAAHDWFPESAVEYAIQKLAES